MTRCTGRPCGTFGPIAQALLQAAAEPGTVTELARRAQVGTASARYTASRLLSAGELEVVDPGTRPAVLVRPQQPRAEARVDLAAVMSAWR